MKGANHKIGLCIILFIVVFVTQLFETSNREIYLIVALSYILYIAIRYIVIPELFGGKRCTTK